MDRESGRDVDNYKKVRENRRYGTQRRSSRRFAPYGKETQALLQELSEAERACEDN